MRPLRVGHDRLALHVGPILINGLVFAALVGLMTLDGAVGLATIILSLTGLALWGRGAARDWGAEDTRFAIILAALPVVYLINYLVLGGDLAQLDKPSRLLLAIIMFLGLRSLGVSPYAVLWGAILGAFLASGYAYYQTQFLDLPRAFGVVHPIPFGNYALLLCGIVVAGWGLLTKGRARTWSIPLMLLACLAGLWASAASGSRGGWAAIPIFAYILSLLPSHIRPWHRATLLAAIVVAMLASYAWIAPIKQRVDPAIQETLSFLNSDHHVSQPLGSFGTRLEMWRVGGLAFREHPWLGTGFPGFEAYLDAGIAQGKIHPEVALHKHLHNEIMTTLAKLGLLGLSALLLFWLGGWRYFASRVSRADLPPEVRFFATVGLLTMGGALVFSLSDSMFGTTAGISALALLLAVAAGGMRHFERRNPE